MSTDRYAQVRRLFLAACELSPSEIGAFLGHACAGDPKLREELESLLKQPRTTTIIGTSSEDAAGGKILSPLAHLPRELIPADIPVEAARAEKPSRFSPGDIIVAQRYKILGPLGGGGAGEVYRAHDQIMGQDVALKFLALGQTGGTPTCSRFVSEVAMAREVAHPNVVRVYDIGQLADGEVFISMEFIDGENLASLLRRAGRLSREKTVQIARELCAGLGARARSWRVAPGPEAVEYRDRRGRSRSYRRFRHRGFRSNCRGRDSLGRHARVHGPRIVSPPATLETKRPLCAGDGAV